MGLLDFLTGKSKAAPAPAGATDTAAASPEELKKEITKHGLDASKVDVKVEGGKVTLSGSAPSTAEAEKIVLAIGNTKGVAQVENKILAAKPEPEFKILCCEIRRHALENRGVRNTARDRARNIRRFLKRTSLC